MKSRNERIANVVTMLGEAWRQKITEATMIAFASGTDDLPIEDVERAAKAAIQSSQFMPSVFELRQLAGAKAVVIHASDKPTLAWEAVRRAIKEVGAYKSPRFDDAVIHAVIRQMGGWVPLCDSTLEELVWREKDFKSTYSALSGCELSGELMQRLTGIIEKENGSALPVPVAQIGCLTTGTHGIIERREEVSEPPRRIGIPIAATALANRLTFDDSSDEQPKPPQRTKEDMLAALEAMKS